MRKPVEMLADYASLIRPTIWIRRERRGIELADGPRSASGGERRPRIRYLSFKAAANVSNDPGK